MTEKFLKDKIELHCGDCLAVLPMLAENSIDACVCDPPYHLVSVYKRFANESHNEKTVGNHAYGRHATGFMGKQWDGGDVAFRVETWREVYRVLKPGAHLVAFGGTRTYHRMACAIEDAGFEIRDTIMWLYGSGFPKSHDVSKGIDRAVGAEREVIATGPAVKRMIPGADQNKVGWEKNNGREYVPNVSQASTDAAKQWEGWGTALKPACEPIVLARKPLSEGTVAANVLRWGTGAINVDGCRIEANGDKGEWPITQRRHDDVTYTLPPTLTDNSKGRWPANLITDGSDEVVGLFPETADSPTGMITQGGDHFSIGSDLRTRGTQFQGHGDSGSAARFFFQPKQDCLCGLCNLPYDGSCDANNAVHHSPTESTLIGVSALSDVRGLPLPEVGDNRQQSKKIAIDAEKHSSQCLPQKDYIVQKSAPNWPLSRIAQNVKSAVNLCDLCATDIARALVALRQAHNAESIQFKDFIGGHNAPILCQQLALYVAGRENTDTILTTESLKQLFGSVFHAIEKNMLVLEGNQNQAPEKSKRFWYGSKADADDRIGAFHPTVKPLDLMQYLVRLVCPKGGTILDCFAGTGTTGEAAWREGMGAVLIEREAEYQADIRRRMALAMAGPDERLWQSIKAKQKDKVMDAGPLFGGTG